MMCNKTHGISEYRSEENEEEMNVGCLFTCLCFVRKNGGSPHSQESGRVVKTQGCAIPVALPSHHCPPGAHLDPELREAQPVPRIFGSNSSPTGRRVDKGRSRVGGCRDDILRVIPATRIRGEYMGVSKRPVAMLGPSATVWKAKRG